MNDAEKKGKNLAEMEVLLNKLESVGNEESEIENVFIEAVGDNSKNAELSEHDLENVAGGIRELDAIKWLINNTRIGRLTWQGTKVAARCIYDYSKYGNAYRTYSKSDVSRLNVQLNDILRKLPSWMR